MVPKFKKKHRTLYLILIFALTTLYPINHYAQSLRLSNFQLVDVSNGKNANFSLADSTTVFVFLSPECPLCQNYTKTINNLAKEYNGKITFIGIFPGSYYGIDEIQTFSKKYSLKIKLFIDEKLQLTKTFSVRTTPTAILSKQKEILYFGAIDNWASTLGKKRNVITSHYLKDALQQSELGLPISMAHTIPVGCLINDN